MRKLLLFFMLSLWIASPGFAQVKHITFNGEEKSRVIDPKLRAKGVGSGSKAGKKRKFTGELIDIEFFYYVQFAVYPPTTPREKMLAPEEVGLAWLIYHKDTQIKGLRWGEGAFYIVKPFKSEEDAQKAAQAYRKQNLSCWYNSTFTGARFELIATTAGGFNEGKLIEEGN